MPYLLVAMLSFTLLSGCQSAYYSAMETVGVHKREIMVDRVEEATEAQQDAQQQFTSALEALKALNQFDGGELETTYNAINDQYEASSDAAEKVSSRIAAIEDVADACLTNGRMNCRYIPAATSNARASESSTVPKHRTGRCLAPCTRPNKR